ncbi:MAG: ATP-dependent DNA helicase RecG [Christensenellaceae bacterium]
MNSCDSVTEIKGIAEKTAKLFHKIEVDTIRDLLYYLPRDYKDLTNTKKISEVKFGETALLCVKILTIPVTKYIRKGMEITSFQVTDTTGIVNIDIFNQRYIKNNIRQGQTIYVYGRVEYKFGRITISSPELYFKKPEDSFLPLYPLTNGLTQNMLRKAMKEALYKTSIEESYSDAFLKRFELPTIRTALQEVHFPTSIEHAKSARTRIVFDELLIFGRMIEMLGEEKNGQNRVVIKKISKIEFTKKLKFQPTNAQIRVMSEIADDLTSTHYMNRLVQGDVGSGKTAIAFFAMDCMIRNGYQSVMMAPTELLADQHYIAAKELFDEHEIVLVVGSMSAKQRAVQKEKIESGSAKIIIGTHALIYGDTHFSNLGLIITDEQHRFGVKQRANLAGAGKDVHTLIMSATPIPRSLALVLYGKTKISIIDELPPGRQRIKTYLIRQNKYQEMIRFVRNEMDHGRQVYMVCPLIEDSENSDARSASEIFEELKNVYQGYEIALLHGKLKNDLKQQIMQRYAEGKIKILICTTVIEVGINIQNASVMVVFNAERFGLAQLHQLRGRVGRAEYQSYCFLLSDNTNAFERLQVLVKTNDGFEIAEKDLQLRGSGDVFGVRQHGMGNLKIANLISDSKQLLRAREVLEILKSSKEFKEEYDKITQRASQNMNEKMIEIAFN